MASRGHSGGVLRPLAPALVGALLGALVFAGCAGPTADHETMRAEIARLTQRTQELEAELAKQSAKLDTLTKLAEKPKLTALGRRAPYFSLEVRGASYESIIKHMALQVGNRWVYACTRRHGVGGRRDKVVTTTWEREALILAHRRVKEGTVVVLRQTDRNMKHSLPAGMDVLAAPRHIKEGVAESCYVIADGYVYHAMAKWGWDEKAGALVTNWRRRLAGDDLTPDFFFPTSHLLRWSDPRRESRDYEAGRLFHTGKGPGPNPGTWYWIVGFASKAVAEATPPPKAFAEAVPITWVDNTCTILRWFADGVGVVRESYSHHGSYYEHDYVLRDLHLAR